MGSCFGLIRISDKRNAPAPLNIFISYLKPACLLKLRRRGINSRKKVLTKENIICSVRGGEVLVICPRRRHSESTDFVKVGHHLRVLTNSSEAKVEIFLSAASKISINLMIHEKME